ncbi:MAG: PepSY-like domain-containing protein [Bacteroidia bacterium]|nr:PepSY-like domain-containing protein [Bacteroidia bacterium]
MKTLYVSAVLALTLSATGSTAQRIMQSQVPPVIVNNFQQSFPKIYDVEWKIDGINYQVEFETGMLGTDHKMWYDSTGKVIRHKEEIAKKDLPPSVLAKINGEYNLYWVDDAEKITEGDKMTYNLELKTLTEEWKMVFDPQGNVLSKLAD